jgi:hypothetical protein
VIKDHTQHLPKPPLRLAAEPVGVTSRCNGGWLCALMDVAQERDLWNRLATKLAEHVITLAGRIAELEAERDKVGVALWALRAEVAASPGLYSQRKRIAELEARCAGLAEAVAVAMGDKDFNKLTRIYRACLRDLVAGIEQLGEIPEALRGPYHAARMYVGKADEGWDCEAAGEAHDRYVRDA